MALDNPSSVDESVQAGARRIGRAIFWFTLLLTIGLMACYLWVSDRAWWSACIVVWPSFLWCLGLVPLTLCCVRLRRMRYAMILTSAICIFVIATGDWSSLVRSESQEARSRFETIRLEGGGESIGLRLVSWNIAGRRSDPSAVFATLRDLGPDICLLQEAHAISEEDAEASWPGYQWLSAGDCGVLSRFPMRRLAGDVGWSGTKHLPVELNLPGGRNILIVCVHLGMPPAVWNIAFAQHPIPYRAGHQRRVGQYAPLMQRIDHELKGLGATTAILAGDFNVCADLASLQPIRSRMSDVWQSHGTGWGATIPSRLPLARIDHCWVTPDVEPVGARVVDSCESDHRPIVVDLILAK